MDLIELQKGMRKTKPMAIAMRVLKGMRKYIADLNREQLAKDGVNDDGEELQPEYSELTTFIKSKKSGTASIIDHVTLFDTGALHKSIFANIDSEEIILGSFDSKVPELSQKYGEFLGLTEENIKKVREEFNSRYLEALEKTIPFKI